jgi:hypothetical protein
MSTFPARLMLASVACAGLTGVAQARPETTSDEVRAVVAEMLADAQNRSSLLAGGNAGHDGKFYLASDDGDFRLNISGNIQFRYIADFRDDDNTVGATAGDDFVSGFQTRRTKLYFDGNVYKTWSYQIEANFDRSSGNFGLDTAVIGHDFGNGWKGRAGQFKLPFSREELISDRYQLAVERSVANQIFTQDYSQGVEVSYSAKAWRILSAFSDGLASKNTDYPNGANQADYALTGRFEWMIAGESFDAFKEFTSERGKPFAALFGAAIHYQDSPNSNSPTDVDKQYLSYTADLSFKGDGWNAYIAGYGRNVDTRGPVGAGNNPDFDDFGVEAQFGVRVTKDTELFARYDAVFLDSDRFSSGNDSFNFLTAGVVEYFAGHAAKATIDVVYAFDETANLVGARGLPQGGFPSSGVGLLGDSEDGEVCARFQFQLLF